MNKNKKYEEGAIEHAEKIRQRLLNIVTKDKLARAQNKTDSELKDEEKDSESTSNE